MRLRSVFLAALTASAFPAVAICETGCGTTNVDYLFSSAPAQSAGGGAAGTGGGAGTGGAAGTGGSTETGGAAGTGGGAGTSGAGTGGAGGGAGTGGAGTGGAGGGAGAASTCDPSCTQGPGCPLSSCWTASAEPNDQAAKLAIDGNEGTRYTTNELASGDEWLQIDLCQAETVTGINVFTSSGTDAAASYTVQVSMDGSTWQTVLTSTTPAQQRMSLTFAPVTEQYVRLNQTGKMGFWWSVHEMSVVCQ